MKNIQVNKVNFRGQYAIALELLLNGNEITMRDFKNGKWEATSKVKRFMELLDKADIMYMTEGESLRTAKLTLGVKVNE